MQTNATSAATSQASTSASAQSQSRLADNFDDFLTLLTTQLQNQDPLEPLDSNEFTQQLVQFSSVEQAIATNSNLEKLLSMQQTKQSSEVVNYLGRVVEASGNKAELSNGSATWKYELPDSSDKTRVTILNDSGKLVYTTAGATGSGVHEFAWDGLDSNGNQLPDGVYSIAVTAFDANGELIETSSLITGVVDSVDTANGEQTLNIGAVKVPLDDVRNVRAAPTI